jgi:tRNA(Ile)-lysidine synthase
MAQSPINNDELDTLFALLDGLPRVVLAVSGGADSMALMHLFARWRDRTVSPPPDAVVVTVDHGLRASAADEAKFVAEAAAGLGLPHVILTWTGKKPKSRLQELARAARYRLLGDFAQANAIAAVVTAHHQDDQAETVLMRLARGSGLDGLSGMAPQTTRDGVDLLRPLLGVSKARLLATLGAAGQTWCEDPSNTDAAFERVRVRQAQAHLEALGLSSPSLAASARRLQQARQALDAVVTGFVGKACTISRYGYVDVARAALVAEPREIVIRVVQRALRAVGDARQVRLSKIEALCDGLLGHNQVATTLAGCLVVPRGQTISFFREPGRSGLPEIVLNPGDKVLWDSRFEVFASPVLDGPVAIRALGRSACEAVKEQLETLPREALVALPAVWRDDHRAALPHFVAPCCNDTTVVPNDRPISVRYSSACYLFGLTGRDTHITSRTSGSA